MPTPTNKIKVLKKEVNIRPAPVLRSRKLLTGKIKVAKKTANVIGIKIEDPTYKPAIIKKIKINAVFDFLNFSVTIFYFSFGRTIINNIDTFFVN